MATRKCIIIKRSGKILSLLFHDMRLLRVNAEEESGSILGGIYIARVQNVVKNINAAFVEIQPGYNCFLSLDGIKKPVLCNRGYDGRILQNDEIVVQVYKEAVKTKPPSVTSVPALDGKYCVVSWGKPGISFSGKLSLKVRQRIKEALSLHMAEDTLFFSDDYRSNMGIIIRTNARELADDMNPLTDEIRQLSERLHEIIRISGNRTCYTQLYAKASVYLNALRDLHSGQYEEIVTDEQNIYAQLQSFSMENQNFNLPPVRFYEDDRLPLSKLYAVEARLKEALNKKVWLKSGGYLIIEPTEALTVIDVNSGKTISNKEAAETYFRMNMEAADEIVLQLILRNLSGIIIVDFINMPREEHRKKLMAHFGDILKRDVVKTQLIDITALGLVELTRMKTSKPLKDQLM